MEKYLHKSISIRMEIFLSLCKQLDLCDWKLKPLSWCYFWMENKNNEENCVFNPCDTLQQDRLSLIRGIFKTISILFNLNILANFSSIVPGYTRVGIS